MFFGESAFLQGAVRQHSFPLAIAVVPEYMLASDRLLSVIFGSAIFAAGVAILYKIILLVAELRFRR